MTRALRGFDANAADHNLEIEALSWRSPGERRTRRLIDAAVDFRGRRQAGGGVAVAATDPAPRVHDPPRGGTARRDGYAAISRAIVQYTATPAIIADAGTTMSRRYQLRFPHCQPTS